MPGIYIKWNAPIRKRSLSVRIYVYATAAPFLRQIKKPIMQYEFCLQMQYLTKQVSKIISGMCLKHGVYLDANNNNH